MTDLSEPSGAFDWIGAYAELRDLDPDTAARRLRDLNRSCLCLEEAVDTAENPEIRDFCQELLDRARALRAYLYNRLNP